MLKKIILLLTSIGFTSALNAMHHSLAPMYAHMSNASQKQIKKINSYILNQKKTKKIQPTKTFIYTNHAQQRLQQRGISKEEIGQVMTNTTSKQQRTGKHTFNGTTVVAAGNIIITAYKNKKSKSANNNNNVNINTIIDETPSVETKTYAPDHSLADAQYEQRKKYYKNRDLIRQNTAYSKFSNKKSKKIAIRNSAFND